MSVHAIGVFPSAEPWHDPDALQWRALDSAETMLRARTEDLSLSLDWFEDPRYWRASIRVTEYRLDPASRKGHSPVPLAHADFAAKPTDGVKASHTAQVHALRSRQSQALLEAQEWAEKTARILESNRKNPRLPEALSRGRMSPQETYAKAEALRFGKPSAAAIAEEPS